MLFLGIGPLYLGNTTKKGNFNYLSRWYFLLLLLLILTLWWKTLYVLVPKQGKIGSTIRFKVTQSCISVMGKLEISRR